MNDKPFDISANLSLAWKTFTAHAVPLIVGLLLAGLLSAVTLGLAGPGLMVGYSKMVLRAVRGEEIEVGDVFEGFSYFVPALIVGIVVVIGVSLGLVLLVLPGLFLAFLWAWVWYLMADGAEGVGDILAKSAAISKSDMGGVFVYVLVAAIISAAGSVVPLGGLVTAPLSACMFAIGYDNYVKANG